MTGRGGHRTPPMWLAAAAVISAVAVVAYWFVGRGARTPGPDSPVYEQAMRSFYRGLASLDVGLLDQAIEAFTVTAEAVPMEPAAWANLALAEMRLGNTSEARAPMAQAAALSPRNSHIALLQGRLSLLLGDIDEGLGHLRRAADLDERNLQAQFALAQEIEAAAGANAERDARAILDRLLARHPDNLAILLERTRLAARTGDADVLRDALTRLAPYRSVSAQVVEQYDAFAAAVNEGDSARVARALVVLRNVLLPTPQFQEGLAEVSVSTALVAEPIDRFLVLAEPPVAADPPDLSLAFRMERARPDAAGAAAAGVVTPLDENDPPVMLVVGPDGLVAVDGGRESNLLAPALTRVAPRSPHGLIAVDWNHDFKMDLMVTGTDGVQLLLQEDSGAFVDRTPRVDGTPGADITAAWAADLDMDGDLDAIVAVPSAPPVVLRNNGDGAWSPRQVFNAVSDLRDVAWGDLDDDGDPDLALLDGAGDVHVLVNHQNWDFRADSGAPALRRIVSVALGDVNGDARLDLVTFGSDGTVRRVSPGRDGWTDTKVAEWPDLSPAPAPGTVRLTVADVDNNGALDLVASMDNSSRIWLGDERGALQPLAATVNMTVSGVADINGDGQLDLVGLSEGQLVRAIGEGTKGYRSQTVRPRAQTAAGDQRINSFAIGGDIEIRSGLLVQRQIITGPIVHFGLGTRSRIDVAQIVWPNGVAQAEFDRQAADGAIVAVQRLKGSCPWVFANDGRRMQFVTDFLWRSPLGLRINAQDTAGVSQTEDWIKIRGEQLQPVDGVYDVRITADLWETHFFDRVSLMAVDHPDDVEVFVDERFAVQPPVLAVQAFTQPVPVPRAWDEAGQDVTELIAERDGRYLATFEPGRYQGLARDHAVEIEIGAARRGRGPLWLVAYGWIYPTDSSINMAIGQGEHERPRGLSLEAQDADGRWTVVAPDLGFPAGKNKTILVDLSSVRAATRLRLRTNLEVYWDWLGLATAVPDDRARLTPLQTRAAELRYRGFSRTSGGRTSGPELPIYDEIVNVRQQWRDLEGFYTRFGDVAPLVDTVDDRYVIMNAGDELRFTFVAPPPPPPGWRRDFVLVGDGWVKDGDYNTAYSKTVLPLPSHDNPNYVSEAVPPDLHSDPVYRRHASDWETYHTRFVSPRDFLRRLRHKP